MSDKLGDSNDARIPEGSYLTTRSPAHPRFSLRTLFTAILVLCVLLASMVAATRTIRRANQTRQCSGNIKALAMALLCYRQHHKTFPPAITYSQDGTPMHSWRVLVHPWVEQMNFTERYDLSEPWNGTRNRLLCDETPDTFMDSRNIPFRAVYHPYFCRCPSAPNTQSQWVTNYVMLIDDQPGKTNGPPNRPGSAPPSAAPDSAVILIEIAKSDIQWTEPRDVLLSELSMKINDRSKLSLSSYHGGACIAHADGSVEVLDEATTEERLRKLLAQ